ncbi:hypothetical protein G7054_g11706 [Neopestalotiopsis clavispora]|nr:hypothetical protein G7054_g11706 [Neopestalotiopsis clavispora]
MHQELALNWPKYFSKEHVQCPPLIYLDLWPLLSQPLIYAISPEACYQLVQQKPEQPRHPMFSWAMSPVTGGKDLIAMDIPTHRLWRSRLNPGFSTQNILSQTPLLIEEINIFVAKLKARASKADVFSMYDHLVALAFDVITRGSLGMRLKEQTNGPTPFFEAFRQLITHVKGPSLWNELERLTPAYKRQVASDTKVLDDVLSRHIKECLEDHSDSPKTAIDFALKDYPGSKVKGDIGPSSERYNEIILSQLKLFILAGHNTTAQAICWLLYDINKSSEVLDQLRIEHDQVFGSNPELAAEILSQEPYKLNFLTYTTAVVKESLRLHPLASTHRQGSKEFNFALQGTIYPTTDALIHTNPSVVHLRPDLWPRPTEFLPQRFLVDKDHPLYPVKNAWRAFELGVTRCIGEELAMTEMKLILVLTAREFEFEFDAHGWDQSLQRKSAEGPAAIKGEQIYRVGKGIGLVKNGLPTRVRRRSAKS